MNHFYLLLTSLFILCGGTLKTYPNNNFNRTQVFDYEINFDRSDSLNVKTLEKIVFSFDDRSIHGSIVRSIPIINNEDIDLQSVLCNGKKVPYSTKIENDTFRINIGSEDNNLPIGSYTYNLVYNSFALDALLNSVEDKSQITEDKSYSIDSLYASIDLLMGRISMNVNKDKNSTNKKTYSSSRSLSISNGKIGSSSLTISKIKIPIKTSLSKAQNNQAILVGIGLFLLFLYYGFRWSSAKRMRPEQQSPCDINDQSPAAIRYLYKEYTDVKSLTTIIISLATKKHIKIEKLNSKYNIVKTSSEDDLIGEEKFIYGCLFVHNRQSVEIDWDTSFFWNDVGVSIKGYMAKLYNVKDYFIARKVYLLNSRIVSIVLVFIWLVLTFFLADVTVFSNVLRVVFIAIPLSVSIYARYTLRGYDRFRHILLSCLICFFSLLMVLLFFQPGISTKLAVLFVCSIIGANIHFTKRFKQPTSKGVEILNEIKNFKKKIEDNKYHILSKQQIEEMLPYVVALDLEKEFDRLLKKQSALGNYRLDWFVDTSSNKSDTTSLNKLSKGLTLKIVSLCAGTTLYSKKER